MLDLQERIFFDENQEGTWASHGELRAKAPERMTRRPPRKRRYFTRATTTPNGSSVMLASFTVPRSGPSER